MFTWEILGRNLAEKGYLNKPNMTPLESIRKENLHTVLYYINLQAIEAKENEQS